MSKWEDLEIASKVIEILRRIERESPDHHFGSPFITAYQLAIEYKNNHPDDEPVTSQPLGGAGIGQHSSLAQYLARMLSKEILEGRLNEIEGSFISNKHLENISFSGENEPIVSSLTETNNNLSMFRIKNE